MNNETGSNEQPRRAQQPKLVTVHNSVVNPQNWSHTHVPQTNTNIHEHNQIRTEHRNKKDKLQDCENNNKTCAHTTLSLQQTRCAALPEDCEPNTQHRTQSQCAIPKHTNMWKEYRMTSNTTQGCAMGDSCDFMLHHKCVLQPQPNRLCKSFIKQWWPYRTLEIQMRVLGTTI